MLFTLNPYFLLRAIAIAAPDAAPNKPIQLSFTVPIISRLKVSIPAAGPRFAKSLAVLGDTINVKSTAFAPIA